MTAVLGIDLGTQGVTALAVDLETGRPMAAATAPLGLHVGPAGVRQQDPQWWWDATVAAVSSFEGMPDVQAVAVGAQQHGLVCLDTDGSALGPASLWNDTSSEAWCATLTGAVGGVEEVRRLIGMDLRPGYTAPQLARLRDSEPERYLKAAMFCLPHDYLTFRLCGEVVTDEGDASGTGYFDIRDRRWNEEMLRALDPHGDLGARLPAVAPPGVAVGELTDEAARALQLRPGVAVVNGTGDNMATAVAMGLFSPGRLGVSLGTSATAFAYSAQPACDPLGEAAAFCDATGGWLPLVCTLNCTQVLHATAHLVGTDLDGLERAAMAVGPGAAGLVFLPYLDGERTPSLPEGSGALVRMRFQNMSPAHVARATYEGVALALGYGLEALGRAGVTATSVTVAGGGAASPLLRQLLADVTGLAVRRVPNEEPTAWGAAALAAWALSGEDVSDIVRRWWRQADPVRGAVAQPQAEAADIYAAERERRRLLLDQMFPGALPRSEPVSALSNPA